MHEPYVVYGMAASGNCYKIKMALERLGLPYRWHEVDVVGGETKGAAFKALNPNGKVPVLQLPDGQLLAESNAILWYLAQDSTLWPAERLAQAEVMQWLFFEQYSHEPYIATVRFWVKFAGKANEMADEIAKRRVQGYRALDVMERRLTDRAYLAGEHCTIADLALYAYTHVAEEGGFTLGDYPAIGAWMKRVAAAPQHVQMG